MCAVMGLASLPRCRLCAYLVLPGLAAGSTKRKRSLPSSWTRGNGDGGRGTHRALGRHAAALSRRTCPFSAGHVKKPDLLCLRTVEQMDRVEGGLQYYLAAPCRRVAIHAHVRWHRDARPMALPALDNSSRNPQVVYDWFIDVGV